MRKIKRGQVYFADLNPVVGSEQGGVRPVLIIQNNVGNQYSPTVIVGAITKQKKPGLVTHVRIDDVKNMENGSIVMLEHIRTIDKSRLGNYCCELDEIHMRKVEKAMAKSLSIREKEEKPIELCLCPRCANQFYHAPGTIIRRADYDQIVKETCDFCGSRMGYDFYIGRKKATKG
ncbi:MAG: type II toxin-antitoxin system PemK/MazF family toxin [Clostridia bacterium]|nr:type II toxin-antitoxin system PemK/MazF family toxin [Clostridia bacterium]